MGVARPGRSRRQTHENQTQGARQSRQAALSTALFESLRDLHRQRGSLLVLVFLPMRADYDDEASGAWRAFVHDAAATDDIPVIDLVDDLRTVPAGDIDAYFIKPGELPYGHAEGHYTVRGNDFIARALYQKLLGFGAVAAKLSHTSADPK